MPAKSSFRVALLAASLAFTVPVHAADDASMHQVYLAAESGKFIEAQKMMDKVLRDHPNSAKAHFVEAELLAKQGRFSDAQGELNNARRLAPELPFAKPTAVQNLTGLIGSSQAARHSLPIQQAIEAPASSGMPWGVLLAGIGLIAFITFAVRFMGRRAVPAYAQNASGGPAPQPSYAGGPTQ